jgi:glycosyltransferase involved in cell wall biosynthesis
MRVALLSYNAQAGDAIGNLVAEKLLFFLERGADVRAFVESDKRLHPAVRPHCQRLERVEPAGSVWEFLTSADLLIVEYGQFYRALTLLPLLVGGRPRILFDYHGVTPPELWSSHNREALEKGLRQRGLVWCADTVLVHSRFTRQELIRPTSYPQERVHVLGHPVDLKTYCPSPSLSSFRSQLGLESASILLFVGRLAPNKRVLLLVEALARLREVTPPVHLVLAGDTSDLYQAEAERCRARAQELGLAERVHLLGHVSDEGLKDVYRAADVLVMPSRHEGFCIPVLEAMACGVPVVAARAGALPETVGSAGLTFTPDDVEDFARQLLRVLPSPRTAVRGLTIRAPRVALVAFRFGTDFAGGAERSLHTMATALQETGHTVEVFTTCTRSESAWANELPEGASDVGGLTVHRFRIDPHDRERHGASVRAILQAEGPVSSELEKAYLTHSVHSSRLLEELRRRQEEFDAVLVGPYLFGLTLDVALAFPEKTVLVPCFHDEPFARLASWRTAYQQVGGILYHSPEEQEFADIELGLNHPGAVCLGTWLDTQRQGDPEAGRRRVGTEKPYLVYCGRYSVQKNLPVLLDYAQRYQKSHPDRFTIAFLGQGEVSIPMESWAKDLGFVEEAAKHDILAGAAALVQLSCYESLSLVALEAWAQGVPVLAHSQCPALVGHLRRSSGGQAVDGYEEFCAALDSLWQQPEHWQRLGRRGQDYTRTNFGSQESFCERLRQAIDGLEVPLAERMRRQGLQRAALLDRTRWRERFGRLVEDLLDTAPRLVKECVAVCPRTPTRSLSVGQESVLIPVRVINRGTHAVVAEGPAKVRLRCLVTDQTGQPCGVPEGQTSLPGLVLPGQEIAAAVRVLLPGQAGTYRVGFWAQSITGACLGEKSWLDLTLVERWSSHPDGCCDALLETVQTALSAAEQRQTLPDDYTDITEGLLSAWKRRIKRKLLGNFKHAYVDVLSRQQSAFNRHILTALQELAECCTLLDHGGREAGAAGKVAELAKLVNALLTQLDESRGQIEALDKRLQRLEKLRVRRKRHSQARTQTDAESSPRAAPIPESGTPSAVPRDAS